ncbi:hypothetical protein TNCV_1412361 [Trichonephila clavipes]|nr:hypothetical protein TNCV_1412361 [Trichonephila clavipes]
MNILANMAFLVPSGKIHGVDLKRLEHQVNLYKHKNSFLSAAAEAMRPIFRDLSHPDLLKMFAWKNTKPK